MQTLVAMLIHGPDLPAPLAELSPWVDFLMEPIDVVTARLDAQDHRRVLKTHTPLDGVPRIDGVHYAVVARHPLDAAVSLWHQGANLDRARMAELSGSPAARGRRPPLEDWLRRWIAADADPRTNLESLPGVIRHLTLAWSRRHDPDLVLVRYDDLRADLPGELARLADRLGLSVRPGVAEAAGFEQMRANADRLAPDQGGILLDRTAFFRSGRSGDGARLLTSEEYAGYRRRVAVLAGEAGPEFLAWLHPGE
ncbi:glycolipid sulfotransferase [Sporichthya brevicatena]|uniref:Glycolipid sulfotransferase n=2 Tax=Sporichthya brevicatena TaxID=171442 RepID=A0ABN1GXF4_9ACTN